MILRKLFILRGLNSLNLDTYNYYVLWFFLQDPLRIAGKENPHNALFLPEKTRSLRIEGCHHVEVFAKTFNHAAHLKNVTISGCGKAILHPRMYHIGSGTPPKFSLFEINNVRKFCFIINQYTLILNKLLCLNRVVGYLKYYS